MKGEIQCWGHTHRQSNTLNICPSRAASSQLKTSISTLLDMGVHCPMTWQLLEHMTNSHIAKCVACQSSKVLIIKSNNYNQGFVPVPTLALIVPSRNPVSKLLSTKIKFGISFVIKSNC